MSVCLFYCHGFILPLSCDVSADLAAKEGGIVRVHVPTLGGANQLTSSFPLYVVSFVSLAYILVHAHSSLASNLYTLYILVQVHVLVTAQQPTRQLSIGPLVDPRRPTILILRTTSRY